jgi:hypothetical protein
MKAVSAGILFLLPSIASASEMAGVGLFASLPITAFLVVVALVISLMAETKNGFKYLFTLTGFVVLIALFLASHDWSRSDDIQYYRWHLFLTGLVILPLLVLKVRLRGSKNT